MPEVIEKRVGPRGGNLDDPRGHSEWRSSEFKGSPDQLHRFEKDESTVPGRKNEQPWHRMAAYMLLAGRTNSEIAVAADVSPNTVSFIRGQKWFQQLLGTLANHEGDEVLGLIKSEALASVETLVTLRDQSEKDAVRYNAARTIIEHATGKPVQKVISAATNNSSLSPQEEMEQLEAELRSLQNKESNDNV